MTADTLIHEAPLLPRSACDATAAELADNYANPQPAPSEGGNDGGYQVPTQRSAPDPEWPGSGHVTYSEWALIHEPGLSGRAIALNAFGRNGGEAWLAQHTEELPEIPEIVYRAVETPAQHDDEATPAEMAQRADLAMVVVVPLMVAVITVITLLT